MFKLFGKKKNDQQQTPGAAPQDDLAKHPEIAALAAQFDPEEFDILAVTGANGFGGDKQEGSHLWTATLPLTAWREEDGPICQEDTYLVSLADDLLLDYLRRRAPRDCIIQARVRKGLEDDRFLLVGLPTPMMDLELKALLDEQVKEVSFWVDGLGTFVLNRSVNWFQADGEWLGQPIQFTYDKADTDTMRRAQCTAQALAADQAEWDQRVRAYGAEQLFFRANDWTRDETEVSEPPAKITREEFTRRMELESIQIDAQGGFEFWFHNRDLSLAHSIRVSGTLAAGPTNAQMEG